MIRLLRCESPSYLDIFCEVDHRKHHISRAHSNNAKQSSDLLVPEMETCFSHVFFISDVFHARPGTVLAVYN